MIAVADAPTIGTLRRGLAAVLAEAAARRGVGGTPALDARLLVAHALGCHPGEVPLRDEQAVTAVVRREVASFAERRRAGEPVARIVGVKEFWGLAFELSPETLVPRPDTETVVAAALAFVDRRGRREAKLRILDIGTGTGAILIALLSELPGAIGLGTDRAPGAAATARRNAARHGVDARAHFVVCNWAAAAPGGFDLVVANPPYVESAGIATLPVEVGAHDPHLSLDGGPDGLGAYRAFLSDLSRLLNDEGRALLEMGAGQADAVRGLAAAAGFAANGHRDLAGTERVVELFRQ